MLHWKHIQKQQFRNIFVINNIEIEWKNSGDCSYKVWAEITISENYALVKAFR